MKTLKNHEEIMKSCHTTQNHENHENHAPYDPCYRLHSFNSLFNWYKHQQTNMVSIVKEHD